VKPNSILWSIFGLISSLRCKKDLTQNSRVLNAYNALRHSWASQRLNQGFPLEEISAVFGHSSFEMTRKVYAQYRPDRLQGVIKGKPNIHRLFITKNDDA
jgi:site-specific recombinase XerD